MADLVTAARLAGIERGAVRNHAGWIDDSSLFFNETTATEPLDDLLVLDEMVP